MTGEYVQVASHAKVGFYLDGLSRNLVSSKSEADAYLNAAQWARSLKSVSDNVTSDRSHVVINMTVIQKKTSVDLKGVKTFSTIESVLTVVDMGSSERCSIKDASKVAATVDQSLNGLDSVVNALVQRITDLKVIVPYRTSMLTMLLKNALGGNSKTIMIGTISPTLETVGETLNTLRFLERARQVANKPLVIEDFTDKTIKSLKAEVEILTRQLPDVFSNSGIDVSNLLEEEIIAAREKLTGEKEKEISSVKKLLINMETERNRDRAQWANETAERYQNLLLKNSCRGVETSKVVPFDQIETMTRSSYYLINMHTDMGLSGKICLKHF
jgi:hypothetical protein